MIETLSQAERIAFLHSVPIEDVILIALNASGIRSNTYKNRLRFEITFAKSKEDQAYFCAIFSDNNSNFSLKMDKLYLGNELVAIVKNIEIDTCSSSYYRNSKKVITINSNINANCKGCAFCASSSLINSTKNPEIICDPIEKFCNQLEKMLNLKTFSSIERVAICTGCFDSEKLLTNHLLELYSEIVNRGFKGSFVYIGSELLSTHSIKYLSEAIAKFEIYFTLELFTNRDKILRKSKSNLTLDKAEELMRFSKACGVKNNIVTILGLESFRLYLNGIERFKYLIHRFPIINIFQPFPTENAILRHKEASDISYYLGIRKKLETMFKNESYKPRVWECYRSLWYSVYNTEKLYGSKI